jgi:hypothetical protein
MTYLLTLGGRKLAFSGDLMLEGAKMHTWFDTEWDYGFAAGIKALRQSVALQCFSLCRAGMESARRARCRGFRACRRPTECHSAIQQVGNVGNLRYEPVGRDPVDRRMGHPGRSDFAFVSESGEI